MPAPLVIFTYNRLSHTRQTLDALLKNNLAEETEAYIFSDGPKNDEDKNKVDAVRKYLRSISGFLNTNIIERKKNLGLSRNIIDGVDQIINTHGDIIVVEDDLISSPYLLSFLNKALNEYKREKNVFSISGYNYPNHMFNLPDGYDGDVYFVHRNCSWGWATWADRWNRVDWEIKDYDQFDSNIIEKKKFMRGGEDLPWMLGMQMRGEIDSWSIRFMYTQFKQNGITVYPRNSYINNIGFDNSGVHSRRQTRYYNDLSKALPRSSFPKTVFVDSKIEERFRKVHKKSLIYKTIRWIYRRYIK